MSGPSLQHHRPRENSALVPISTQLLTGIKLEISIKLTIYSLHWYFQQNQCLNIEKHAVYNMHRLALAPMLVGPSGNFPTCPGVKTTLCIFRWYIGNFCLQPLSVELLNQGSYNLVGNHHFKSWYPLSNVE